jgi:signal transduction histidine kinase
VNAADPGAIETAERDVAPGDRATVRAAERMPNWMGSIRVRLALLYSSTLFVIAAIFVIVIYLALANALKDEPVTRDRIAQLTPQGVQTLELEFQTVERASNARALDLLKNYSLTGLVGLFVVSLGTGWFTSGRVLAPIGRITQVAKEIQATDLSRRIDLGGPPDELRDLADTFDDMLERIDDAFDNQKQFIHEASHELRNPLAVIQTNLDVALADPDASADDLRQTLAVVRRSSERMNRLVDDLLVYARKGSLSFVREPVDLADLVNDLVAEFRAPADAGQVALVESAAPGLWTDGDRGALRQALANLMANAIRLSPSGSTVRVRAGRHEGWVWMAVEDDGPGIAVEDQERVFQRFWRGEKGGGRSQGRSGLGLTIVRQIAEAHSGEVKLVSELGVGSAFAIWLPAAPPDGAPDDHRAGEPATAPLAGPPPSMTSTPASASSIDS